jgi:hypothetical protein
VLPDPNWFGGAVELSVRGEPFRSIVDEQAPYGAANRTLGDGSLVADYRVVGLAEMEHATRTGADFRASGALALQVLAAMEAITAET